MHRTVKSCAMANLDGRAGEHFRRERAGVSYFANFFSFFDAFEPLSGIGHLLAGVNGAALSTPRILADRRRFRSRSLRTGYSLRQL